MFSLWLILVRKDRQQPSRTPSAKAQSSWNQDLTPKGEESIKI